MLAMISVISFFKIFYFCGQLLKGQKQEERERARKIASMIEIQKAEKRDRSIDRYRYREKEREEREREKDQKSKVELEFHFLNAAIQWGPASGDTRYVELRRYYIAARVPTCPKAHRLQPIYVTLTQVLAHYHEWGVHGNKTFHSIVKKKVPLFDSVSIVLRPLSQLHIRIYY
jgi:hypothetical protein